MMTNFARAIEIIKKDLEDCAKSYYDDGEVNSVKELIDLYDWSNLDLKEEIYEILKLVASTTNFPYCFNDDCDIEEDDGTLIPFGALLRKVKKLSW